MHFLARTPEPDFTRFFTIDEVLKPYVYVFYAAFIVAFIFTPIMRVVATYYGIIDQPDNTRKMHDTPVAYLGGMAVFLGWLSGLAITQFLGVHRPEFNHLKIEFAIIAGACIIVILGLWDDVFHISPRAKILGQVIAAVALLASNIGHRSAWIFISPLLDRLHLAFPNMPMMEINHPVVIISSWVFVIFLVVSCCNATNLMDGLDGLCGGVTGIIAAGFLFLAIHLAMRSGAISPDKVNLDGVRVVLGLALLGSVLGFVPFNFNPASIFMGDTGSMFLGYSCAIMIILFSEGAFPKWFLASMVIFALPVLDTALAVVRRMVNKKPLFSPDRHHFHHQLVARGYTVKQTVSISYGLALLFAVLGVAIVFVRTRYAVALYLIIFAYVIVAAYKMGMVHERPRLVKRKPIGPETAAPVLPELEDATVIDVTPTPSDVDKNFDPRNIPPGTWADSD